jgi:Putative polyhydroxyalkanoic acid system protein (PHA_gran_rgn)
LPPSIFVEIRRANIMAPIHPRYVGTLPVSDRVTIIVSHRVGKVEAIHRLKEGFGHMKGNLGPMVAIEQETWEGDTLRFHMRALGQTAAGTIQVLDDALRIEVSLPWLLAQAAKRVLPILRKEATRLLDKK